MKKYRDHEAQKKGDVEAESDLKIDVTSRRKRLLIIGMSANSDSETKRLAKEAGMDHFLEKPFAVADFVKLVRES